MLQNTFFYYGTENPPLEKTRGLKDSLIVLQPYHPLVIEGKYKDFFPHCRKYLYWSAGCLHQDEDSTGLTFFENSYSAEWNTKTVDLSDKKNFKSMLSRVEDLRRLPGIDGIFVDNLDLMIDGHQQEKYCLSILKKISKNYSLYLNRGFSLWGKVDQVEAVLLESLTPESIFDFSDTELNWLEKIIILNVKKLKSQKNRPALFAMSYSPLKERVTDYGDFKKRVGEEKGQIPRRFSLYNELWSSLTNVVAASNVSLNHWPQEWSEN